MQSNHVPVQCHFTNKCQLHHKQGTEITDIALGRMVEKLEGKGNCYDFSEAYFMIAGV